MSVDIFANIHTCIVNVETLCINTSLVRFQKRERQREALRNCKTHTNYSSLRVYRCLRLQKKYTNTHTHKLIQIKKNGKNFFNLENRTKYVAPSLSIALSFCIFFGEKTRNGTFFNVFFLSIYWIRCRRKLEFSIGSEQNIIILLIRSQLGHIDSITYR